MRCLVAVVLLMPAIAAAQPNEPCTSAVAAVANQERPRFASVVTFLSAFGPECEDNVEFEEWGNRVLFNVLAASPSQFLRAMRAPGVKQEAVLAALRAPLLDERIAELRSHVAVQRASAEREAVLAALEEAARSLE